MHGLYVFCAGKSSAFVLVQLVTRRLHAGIDPQQSARRCCVHGLQVWAFFFRCCGSVFIFLNFFFVEVCCGNVGALRQCLYVCTSKASKASLCARATDVGR